jgi:hypothetical protein
MVATESGIALAHPTTGERCSETFTPGVYLSQG